MFAIKFTKFDMNGNFVGTKTSAKKYTKRQAMAHLENNGMRRLFNSSSKLCSCYTNGNGLNATII